ncbi:MAG: HupE/UreJ family protein [Pseudomonadales bacterium]
MKNKIILAAFALLFASGLAAHGVADGDKAFLEQVTGMQIGPYIYLGAKHMITGYDHLLFLFGVIFFLYRMKDITIYVTLFAVGHSTTLLFGVLTGTNFDAFLIDAIIGLSVVYKALDNMGAFEKLLGYQPNTKAAVLIFGFFHGFGLATKLQEFTISNEGLVPNIIAFNVGVEIGQILALGSILILMSMWRRTDSFRRQAISANTALMCAGVVLVGFQLTGYFSSVG